MVLRKKRWFSLLLVVLILPLSQAAASGPSGGFTSQQCFVCHSDLALLDLLVSLRVPPPEECSI
jgi:hypothetical protein